MKRAAVILSLVILLLTACSEGGTEPRESDDPQLLRLELPEFVTEGQPFTLKVTAHGSQTSQPLAGFSATAQLSVSSGTISPTTVQMANGVGEVQTTVNGATAGVTVEAAVAGVQATSPLRVFGPGQLLLGDPDDPAAAAIPDVEFRARWSDYGTGHPDLPGAHLSFNTLYLVFEAGTTIREANGVLAPLDGEIIGGIPGVATATTGILYLRLPTSTHEEMEAALATLQESGHVHAAVQDGLTAPAVVPGDNAAGAESWTWEAAPEGGNFGLELIRAPQMWSLNPKVSSTTVTGVLDVGFTTGHPDLPILENLNPSITNDHGTHVAGTIGANFDNGMGVDGLNPMAGLVVRAVEPPTGAPATLGDGTSIGASDYSFYLLVSHTSRPRVVNISLARAWHADNPPTNSVTDAAAQAQVAQWASVFTALLETIRNVGYEIPLIVSAAGNSAQPAVWGSGRNYAGLHLDEPDILVVESVKASAGAAGGATLSSFSNHGGHVSAPGGDHGPGEQVWSTAHNQQYMGMQGTSMAAPHVTGLATYLLSVDPALSNAELKSLILDPQNTVSVAGGASRRIDAFASVMDIDRIRGDTRILRMLVDMDDGTEDGNRRTDPESGADYTETDADGDGLPGSGNVDMGDFRRWRDAYLALTAPEGLDLDGAPAHPKKDLNDNGKTADEGDDESVYPWADLNGDGKVDLESVSFVPGHLYREVTDLDVLTELFGDPHYSKEHLEDLVESADVAILPAKLLEADGVVEIRSSIRPSDQEQAEDDPRFRRIHTGEEIAGDGLWQVYTVPVAAEDYTVRVVAVDAAGDTLHDLEKEFPAKPGQDSFWDPEEEPFEYTETFDTTAGPEWSRRTIAVAPVGERFLGLFSSHSVRLDLEGLPAHDSVRIQLDLYIIEDWNGNNNQVGGDLVEITADGVILMRATFSNNEEDDQTYPDDLPHGDNPAGTGAYAYGALGFPEPDDDYTWTDTSYRIEFVVPHIAEDLEIRITGSPSSETEVWGIDTVRVTTTGGAS